MEWRRKMANEAMIAAMKSMHDMIDNLTSPMIYRGTEKPLQPSKGDVITEDRVEYIYDGFEWLEIGRIELENIKLQESKKKIYSLRSKCISCGAPLYIENENNPYCTCQYCGTKQNTWKDYHYE